MTEETAGIGRHTRQRLQVTALLEETDEFRSAQRLHEMLRSRGVPVGRHCARTAEVSGPGVERWARRIAHQHGYVDVAQTIELFGTCAECSAQGEI